MFVHINMVVNVFRPNFKKYIFQKKNKNELFQNKNIYGLKSNVIIVGETISRKYSNKQIL